MTKSADEFTHIGHLINDGKKYKPLTVVERRMIESAADIATYTAEQTNYLHTLFCQTIMPYRKQTTRVWEHRNGNSILRVEAGTAYHPEEDRYIPLPLPCGPKARLVQIHLDTQAIRTQSPEIEVETSMTAFAASILGYEPNGREIHILKTQLGALSAASIRIANTGKNPFQVQTHIVSAFDIWFPKDAKQRVLWPSVITLSPDYYQSLIDHAVPLDPRAVAALSHSAMALSIYSWLAQRLCRVNPKHPAFVPWNNLWQQFGQNYGKIFKFRQKFNIALNQVLTQYPHAQISSDRRGLTLHYSRPPIQRIALISG